jgi:glyoxylase-like metal-dependent hydrolase (beta-lactamase superfamily II)
MMAEPANWDVYVMEYARSKDQPWVNLVSGMYNEGVVDLPFSFIFAQRGDDRVLIDTGFMQDEHSSGFSRKFGIPTWISPVRMLAEIGVHSDAINAVFVTHAHFDHMGSIAEFPNAHIYIQKSELLSWYEAFALPKRFGHLTAIVDPDNIRTALDASIAHRVTLIDGDKNDVLPGIHVRLASGHTIGQQFVILETALGRRVLSGDCVYSRRQFTGLTGDGVYVPLNKCGRKRLGAAQVNRQDERRTGRRPVASCRPARHRALEGPARLQGARGLSHRESRMTEPRPLRST